MFSRLGFRRHKEYSRRPRTRTRYRQLGFEVVEDRRLLAFVADFSAGVLSVDITGADEITLTRNGDDLVVAGNDATWVFANSFAGVTDFDITGDNGDSLQIVEIDTPFLLTGNIDINSADTIRVNEALGAAAVTFQAAVVELNSPIAASGPVIMLPAADGSSGLTVDTSDAIAGHIVVNSAPSAGEDPFPVVIGDAGDGGGLTITGGGVSAKGPLTLQTAGTLTIEASVGSTGSIGALLTLQAAIVELKSPISTWGPVIMLPAADGSSGLTVDTSDAIAGHIVVNSAPSAGEDPFPVVIGDAGDGGGLTITGGGVSAKGPLTLQTAGTLTIEASVGSTNYRGALLTLQAAIVELKSPIMTLGPMSIGDDVTLIISGSSWPTETEVIIIVDTNGGVTGTFTGLPEGATIGNVLGSGRAANLTYEGGDDGDDIVLTFVNRPPVADAGGPYTIGEGDTLPLDASGSSDPDSDSLIYRWDVDGDGDYDEGISGPTPSLSWGQLVALGIDHGLSIWTVTVEVSDGEETDTASTTLTVENTVPTLALDPVDMIDENGLAVLAGTLTDPGVGDSHDVVVDWDDPNNAVNSTFALTATKGLIAGDTFSSSTDGAVLSIVAVHKVNGEIRFSLSHTYRDDGVAPGNGTASDNSTIAVAASDEAASDSASSALLVSNLPPDILSFSSDATMADRAMEGETVTVTAMFSDVGTLDGHSATVNWGDGTVTAGVVAESGGSGTVTASHAYASGGFYAIAVTLEDDDNGTSTADTTAVITGVGLNNGVLFVVGTAAGDQISVNQQDAQLLKVHADFLTEDFRNFDVSDVHSIIAYLFEGDDHMTIAGDVSIPAVIHGGAGDDLLVAGGGPAVLLGDSGVDTLLGGAGFDILIGGIGADRLVGRAGEDVLIGGSTQQDSQDELLMAALAAWTNGDDYEDRMAAIDWILAVDDDQEEDSLTGSSGRDLFYGGVEDTLTDVALQNEQETVI